MVVAAETTFKTRLKRQRRSVGVDSERVCVGRTGEYGRDALETLTSGCKIVGANSNVGLGLNSCFVFMRRDASRNSGMF